MDEIRMKYIMTKIQTLLLLLAVTLVTAGCDTIINSVGELPEEPDDDAINQNDPDNPAFKLPGIQLTNGLTLDAPFTITTRDIAIEWEVVDSDGNPITFDYNFSYRIASPQQSISDQTFNDLGTEQRFELTGLNETFNDQFYTFEVRAEYQENSAKDTTFTGQFAVDAFQQRGFLFNPSQITQNEDGTYTAAIYLDEIEPTDDLTAFSLVVSFNGVHFDVSEEDVQVFDESGSFLRTDGVDEVIWFTETTFSSVIIDVGLAGANIEPLSGGGAICEIIFRPASSFSGSTTLGISTGSVLKTSEGFDIAIEAYDEATITE